MPRPPTIRRAAAVLGIGALTLAVTAPTASARPSPLRTPAVRTPAAATSATSTPPAGVRAALDGIVAAGAPGAVAYVRRDGHTWRLASGKADLLTGRAAHPGDRVRIGSATKSFVAAVLLQLEGEGRLSLDDTVDRWLPGVVAGHGNDGTRITVRQLLNHSSGLKDYLRDGRVFASYFTANDYDHVWTPARLVRLAVARRPDFPPGTKATYSNTNYVLAGMVIRAVTGHSPQQEVTRRVIEPLGLRSTAFPRTDPRLHGRHLHGYLANFYYHYQDVTYFSPSWADAAGGMVSTTDDVAEFFRALFDGRLLRPAQVRELTTVAPTPIEGLGNGLGVGRSEQCGAPVWGHDGAFPGYFTQALVREGGDRQVVYAVNSDLAALPYIPGAEKVQQAQRALERAALCDS